MGICQSEYDKLYSLNPSAEILFRNAYNEISGICVVLKGHQGGLGPNKEKIIWYNVYIGIDKIRSEQIPRIFILEPPDHLIEHKNVFHPTFCVDLGRSLPHLCWGDYEKYWKRDLQRHDRTLVCLIRCAEKILGEQCLKPPYAR